ncbi:MAG: flippase [bacterium]|nr:flippase [bacterium]
MLDASLVKITRGAGLVFFGSLVGLGFGFLGRVLVARIGTEAEYGIFSLSFVILNICTVLALLGLEGGIPRCIAYARGKGDTSRVEGFVSASIQSGLLSGIVFGFIVFSGSGIIANNILNDSDLSFSLKVFAFGIPLFTIIRILTALFRGFDNVKPQTFLVVILRNALFPLFLLPFVFFELSFNGVFYAFCLSLAIPALILIVYTSKRLPSFPPFTSIIQVNPTTKELLLFSLPLLVTSTLDMIILWIDTMMLGGFKSSTDVGLYSAAQPLAMFISAPLAAITLIYLPIASRLHARHSGAEIKRNYIILTKWLCSVTLPVFLMLFLYPDPILTSLFGEGYSEASNTLRILSAGFIINNLMGPNRATLIALGKTSFMMWASAVTAILAIALNVALIPPLGVEGAAIASVISITSVNLICNWKIYSLNRILPFDRNLLKPAVASLVLIFISHFTFSDHVNIMLWMVPILFVVYCIIYGAMLLLTRSFDEEDKVIIRAIKSGVKRKWILLKTRLP